MKKGEVREIKNCTMSGKPIIEGKATLVRKIGEQWDREQWMVRFPGESQLYPRWIEKGVDDP